MKGRSLTIAAMGLLTGLVATAAAAAPPASDTVIGRWKAETRGAIIDIQRCGSSICGRLLTSDTLRTHPDTKDVNNRDAAQRSRPLKGMLMLSGFSDDGDAWTGGKVYNAEDGKTYSGKITPIGPNQIKLRGCVFVPLCKTQTWTRVR